jgi:DNA-binding LytR/AlgR family response regulator
MQWRTAHEWQHPWMEPGNWCVNVHGISATPAERTAGFLDEQTRGSRPLILVGERERRLYPLAPEQIDYIESDGNYVKYCLAANRYIARESIRRLEVLLAPVGFMRIERSLLLNVRAIAYVQPIGRGSFAFTLASGTRLQSGAAYRDGILAALPLRRLGRTG